MLGPAKALKGDNSDIVKESADHMRHYMKEICQFAIVSLCSLWIACVSHAWINAPKPLAAILTMMYISGGYVVAIYSYNALNTFRLKEADVTRELRNKAKEMKEEAILNGEGTGDSSGASASGTYETLIKTADEDEVVTVSLQEAANLKFKGYIWKRRTIEHGGTFKKVFAVLDKGLLDIYTSEKHYNNHQAPRNDEPYKLWTYDLELDPQKFEQHNTSIRSAMRKQFLGNAEIKMTDLVGSTFDHKNALKNFRFALLPRVETEMTSQERLELMNEDEKTFRSWVNTIYQVQQALDDEGNAGNAVEKTLRTGVKDLETAVKAANAI